jgi:uncharacterized protein YecA (UPF0149 family)
LRGILTLPLFFTPNKRHFAPNRAILRFLNKDAKMHIIERSLEGNGMERTAKMRDVILRLKQVREERGYSLQKVLEVVLESGGNVSMTTVRRVFADGSEDQNFRYEDTIQPIASALLEVETPGVEVVETAEQAELQALRSLVRYKNVHISELEAAISNIDEKIQAVRDEQQRKVDFLRFELQGRNEQLKAKDQQIHDYGKLLDERRDFIYQKDAAIRGRNWIILVLCILLAACLTFIIGVLIVDMSNPNIGFFWLDDMKAVFGLAAVPDIQGGANL